MRTFLLPLVFFVSIAAHAQKMSQKELEKMAAQAEQMAEKVMKDPRYKKAMAEADEEVTTTSFPVKNKALMATVPNQPLSKPALSTYLNNLYTAYKTKVPVSAVNAAQQAGIKLGNDPDKLGIAAVSSWYNGAPKEAVLMAINASMKKPEDKLLLNNLAALLNMGGAPYHSLPILKTLVSELPDNPMVLNNLGQAFTGAGELDSAMYYFRRCIKQSPHHPEANNTAGQIEAMRGNKEAAATYFENSLKGAYNNEAATGMGKVDEQRAYKLSKFIRPPIDQPYFNEAKYKLPRQSQNADDAALVKQEHDDFWEFIDNVSSAYSEMARQEERVGTAKLEKMLHAAMKGGTAPKLNNPLQVAAGRMYMDIGIGLQAEMADHARQIDKLNKGIQALLDEYHAKRQAIMNDYGERKSQYDCGEGNGAGCAAIERLNKEECKALSALSITTQGAIAVAVSDRQKKELLFERMVFQKMSYYSYLASPNKEMANAAFYRACASYLSKLKQIAGSPILIAGKCEPNEGNTHPKVETDNLKKMECPVNLSVPFVIGKLELNCEKFSFSAGEALVFKYEKDFGSKQSTISIGAGLQFQGGKAFGVFSGEVSASAEQSFYIVFDKDNNINDVGMGLKAEASVGSKASVETPGGIGQEYLTKELLNQKVEFGYTLGVNSGWTFNEGSISSIAKSIGGIFKK